MAIVDVSNRPWVVEIVPDNVVAQFTDESLTVEVPNGTPLVEFRCCDPGVGGGGGGGDGAFYIGVGLGPFANVYKETDDLLSPREHRFRGITAGTNVSLVEDDTQITINVAGASANGETPVGLPVGKLTNTCGASTVFFPSALAGLNVNDLMVWVVVTSTATNSVFLNPPPTGWHTLYRQSYQANQYRAINWFYKFADANDLLPGTSHTMNRFTGSSYTICSSTFFFRNVHPNMPFSGAYGHFGNDNVWDGGYVATFSTAQPVMTAFQVSDSLASWGPVDRIGPPPDHESNHTIGNWNFNLQARMASAAEDENWIPGETLTTSMLGEGWLLVNVSSFTPSTNGFTQFDATLSTPGEHYLEYAVHLTAGKKYSFAFNTINAWNSGDTGRMGIAYLDPLGNLRGIPLRSTGFIGEGGTLDPLSDYGTVWRNNTHQINEDGVPSTTGFVAQLHFMALTTGTHKLRIYVNSSTGWSYTATSAQANRYVNGVVFAEGWNQYRRVFTPNGPIIRGSARGLSFTGGWSNHDNSLTVAAGTMMAGLSITPAWTQLPRAYMVPGTGDQDSILSYDNMTIQAYCPTSDDYKHSAIASRPIMARIDGQLQKYYFEVQILGGNTGNIAGLMWPLAMGMRNDATVQLQYAYSWDGGSSTALKSAFNGVVAPTAPVTYNLTAGTILGFCVDWVNSKVQFFKNGVFAGELPMAQIYPGATASDQHEIEMPMWAGGEVGDGVDTVGSMRFNLAGPFAYNAPAGALPYDWAGAVTTVPIEGIESVGPGVSLVSGTPSNPTIKSLVAGANITITDNGDSVTIAAADSGSAPTTNIDTEVATDVPRAYWKFNEASGAILDSSGNGYDLTTVGSPIAAYQFENFDRFNTTRKGALLTLSSSNYFTRADRIGLPSGCTTFTVEWWGAAPVGATGNIFVTGLNNELATSNVLGSLGFTAAGVPTMLWEYGAGTNSPTFTSQSGSLNGLFAHWVLVKNAADLSVTWYRNGKKVGFATYLLANEHTDGSLGTTVVGKDTASAPAPGGVWCGLAVYNSALSAARIAAHAAALGVQ